MATLTQLLSSNATVMHVSDETGLADGMILQLEDELVRVRYVRDGRAGIERGANGSTQASHLSGTVIGDVAESVPTTVEGSEGDVLSIDAQGAPVWAAAGGAPSSAGVRLVDCGSVDFNALRTGPQELVTGAEGEVILGAVVTDVVLPDSSTVVIYSELSEYMGISDTAVAGNPVGLLAGTYCRAAIAHADTAPWQLNTVYPIGSAVLEANRTWMTLNGLTSGGAKPDFAGSIIDEEVVEGDGTWTMDAAIPPTSGSATVYVMVGTLSQA